MNFVKTNAITSVVPVTGTETHRTAWKSSRNDVRDIPDLVILAGVADVENLLVDGLSRRLENATNRLANIKDMNQGSPGTTVAHHPNLTGGPRQTCEIIENEVKAHSGRWAVGRCIAQKGGGEIVIRNETAYGPDRKSTRLH